MKGLAILAVAVSLTVGVSGERGFEIVFDHSVNDYRVLPANRRNCRESNDARPNDGNSEFDNFFSWTDLCGQDQVNFYKDTDGSNKVRAYIHNGDGKEVALCFYDKIVSDIHCRISECNCDDCPNRQCHTILYDIDKKLQCHWEWFADCQL